MKISGIALTGLLIFMSASLSHADVNVSIKNPGKSANVVTAMNINDRIDQYLGKQVTMNADIDRVLGPGAYIVSDQGAVSGPSHKILLLINGAGTPVSGQQAGVAGPKFQEGDPVSLRGKVEQLAMSAESDTFSPKTDQEVIRKSSTAMPVVVVQPGSIQKVY